MPKKPTPKHVKSKSSAADKTGSPAKRKPTADAKSRTRSQRSQSARASPTRSASGPSIVDAYGNEWTGCQPVPKTEVQALGVRLGKAIPADVVTFIAGFNDGTPKRRAFIDPSRGIEAGLLQVIPVNPQKRIVMSLARYNEVYAGRGDFPAKLFAFAEDLGRANPICVDLTTGGIVWWLHDDSKRPIRELASTLEAFLSRLEEIPW